MALPGQGPVPATCRAPTGRVDGALGSGYQRAQYEGLMREAWKLLGSRLALLQDMAAGRVTNVVAMQRSR